MKIKLLRILQICSKIYTNGHNAQIKPFSKKAEHKFLFFNEINKFYI